jgi:hypothetical protein
MLTYWVEYCVIMGKQQSLEQALRLTLGHVCRQVVCIGRAASAELAHKSVVTSAHAYIIEISVSGRLLCDRQY